MNQEVRKVQKRRDAENSEKSPSISASIHYKIPSRTFLERDWLVSYLHDYMNLQEKVCIL